MRQIELLPLVVLPFAVVLALVAPACGDACEDLAPVCDRCADATTRASCEQTVADNVQDVCSARAGLYERDCPELLTVASSTGVTAAVTSASSGTGAQGGQSAGGQSAGGSSAGGQGGN